MCTVQAAPKRVANKMPVLQLTDEELLLKVSAYCMNKKLYQKQLAWTLRSKSKWFKPYQDNSISWKIGELITTLKFLVLSLLAQKLLSSHQLSSYQAIYIVIVSILSNTKLLAYSLQLFNDSDVMDNYGLSFLNDMGGDKKGKFSTIFNIWILFNH